MADCEAEKKLSKIACTMCLSSDQGNLTAAKCTQADQTAFCAATPAPTPPSPPGPGPPAPPGPGPGPAPDPVCEAKMTADCEVEKKLSTIACKMCISSDQANLTAAKCTQADQTAFCAATPSPTPPP